MEDHDCPFVSVLVLTYNSAHYVLETLNSIRDQTYENIELIISDDCSSDNTIEICKQWLANNNQRFINSEVITVPQNSGTAGNCNRALAKSHGPWLKFLGADDVLLPTAIHDYVHFVEENSFDVVIAEAIHFTGNLADQNFTYERIPLEKTVLSESISAQTQYNILQKLFIGSGPTLFLSRNSIENVGGFDERYPLQEDYPLFLKLTKAGYKLNLMTIDTVYKRVLDNSISHQKKYNSIYQSMVVRCVMEYKYQFKRDEMGRLWKILLGFSLFLYKSVILSGNDSTKLSCLFLYRLQMLLDPISWYARYLNFVDRKK